MGVPQGGPLRGVHQAVNQRGSTKRGSPRGVPREGIPQGESKRVPHRGTPGVTPSWYLKGAKIRFLCGG
jgi:hypothetical protein